MSNVIQIYEKLIPDKDWKQCDELSKKIALGAFDELGGDNTALLPFTLAMALGRSMNTWRAMGMELDAEELEAVQVLSTGEGLS